MAYLDLREGDVIVIRAGEDWPEHLFRVDEVYDDLVTGLSITGPLEGVYGDRMDVRSLLHSTAFFLLSTIRG